jgi:hypothetical protein
VVRFDDPAPHDGPFCGAYTVRVAPDY